MTVRELITELTNLKQDSLVVLSSDSEGNGYSEGIEVNTVAGYKGYVLYPGGRERCELEDVLPQYYHND